MSRAYNLTKKERAILLCKQGARKEFYRAEILDKNGIKKCDVELTEGTIICDDDTIIKRSGTVKFRQVNAYKTVPTTEIKENAMIFKSDSGLLFVIGCANDGTLYTEQFTGRETIESTTSNIKIDDTGLLYTENIAVASKEFEILSSDGTIYNVGIEANGDIYTQTDGSKKIYYTKEKIEIDFLNDRLKVYMGIQVDRAPKVYSLGVFLMTKNKVSGGFNNVQLLDLATLIQQASVIDTKVFAKGTLYTDVLKYFIISCGIVSFNIQPSSLVLPTDLIIDDSKNKLEWFNYVAKQINYTDLTVDNNGVFVSKKYVMPSPSVVDHTYKDDELSVLIGEADNEVDNWQIANTFKVVASNTKQNLYSVYVNDNPADKYSTVSRGQIYCKQTVDNIANQQELDLYVEKLALNARQVTQNVVINTLNMPTHGVGDIVDLRHNDLQGIFVEHGWTINLKSGASMSHKLKRLVSI